MVKSGRELGTYNLSPLRFIVAIKEFLIHKGGLTNLWNLTSNCRICGNVANPNIFLAWVGHSELLKKTLV
jgi:hypothetical protein